jgi:hypothetical protein
LKLEPEVRAGRSVPPRAERHGLVEFVRRVGLALLLDHDQPILLNR